MPSFRLLVALTPFSVNTHMLRYAAINHFKFAYWVSMEDSYERTSKCCSYLLSLCVCVRVCVSWALYPLSPLPLFNGHIKKGLIVVVVVTVTDAVVVVAAVSLATLLHHIFYCIGLPG